MRYEERLKKNRSGRTPYSKLQAFIAQLQMLPVMLHTDCKPPCSTAFAYEFAKKLNKNHLG